MNRYNKNTGKPIKPEELLTDAGEEQGSTPPKAPNGWRRAFRNAFVSLAVVGAIGLAYLWYLARDLPSLEDLQDFSPAAATKIYSRDGKLIEELYTQQRVLIPLDQMPLDVQHALLSMEDRRFYDHWGVSVRDFARAVVVNIASLSFASGFSSLTQQLARNLYDTIGFRKTIARKLREVMTAIQIERTYTKQEILEMYLNSIHFGHGTYGIQAAAQKFFGIDARDLNLRQTAMLVGVLPSPASYSPITHPDRNFWRRNLVLNAMVDAGYIDREEYERIRYEPVEVKRTRSTTGFATYFTEHVRRQMELEDERLGINLYQDGLEIHTTLDSRMQEIVERVFMDEIQNNQEFLNNSLLASDSLIHSIVDTTIYPLDSVKAMIHGEIPIYEDLVDRLLVQGAVVLLENDTGHILAMVGGRTDYPGDFNRATQARRQPGSTFKPIVYMTAIDQGYPVSTQLLDQQLASTGDAVTETDTNYWSPTNDDGSSSGLVTLREALKHSMNTVSSRIWELVTIQQVANMAQRFNLTTPMREVRSLALGTSEVLLSEITAAYATIANRGFWVEPIAVTEVVDRQGKTLREFFPEREEIISEDKAYLLLDLMKGVLDGGTGSRSRWMYGFNRPAAGKTGTTDEWTDAWFIGFTPQLTAGVWIGVDDPSVSLGEERFGNIAALPIWARLMEEIHDTFDIAITDWEMPDGIVVMNICAVTKDRPSKYCPLEQEFFLEGTEPPDECQMHTGVDTRRFQPDDDIFLDSIIN